ncbi:MAG TPA: hypothetical protein P5509_10860 [Bacteroidales bacterium]|nr:hypothetical protein [Bacteroidales bacterium]
MNLPDKLKVQVCGKTNTHLRLLPMLMKQERIENRKKEIERNEII